MQSARLFSRLRSIFRSNGLQREIQDEIELHLELETRKNMRAGLNVREARRQAQIALGATVQVEEECREQRSVAVLETAFADCRYAVRVLSKAPAFSLAVILTATLGIGVNVAVFALCKAMLLATLPVPNPQQLNLVSIAVPGEKPLPYFSYPDLQQMRKAIIGHAFLTGFTEVVGVSFQQNNGTSETIKGQLVAGNFFSVLRLRPRAGRMLTEQDNHPGAEAVTVLSYRFWRSRFGTDLRLLGKRILLGRQPMTVVGVMPEGFDGVEPGVRPDVWMPLSIQTTIGYHGYASMNGIDTNKPWMWQDVSWLHVLGRTSAQLDSRQLDLQLARWLKRGIAAQLPLVTDAKDRDRMLHARIVLRNAAGGLGRLRDQFLLPLQILIALSAVLLFSSCVNIVNLLLARSRAHRHEMAIRTALGGGRIRLIASNIIETLMLVTAGGLLSLPLALWGSRLILHWLFISGDLEIDIIPDWRLIGFAAVATLLSGVAVGLLPALKMTRVTDSATLGQRSATSAVATRKETRLSGILVSGQLAFSIVALVIAGLLTHTLLNYEHLDVGMDRQHVLSVGIDTGATGYTKPAELNNFYRQLISEINRIPGVVSSSIGGCGLMGNGCATLSITVPGSREKPRDSYIERNYVGARYLSTVGMKMMRGRQLVETDTLGRAPVGVVNAEFERKYLEAQSALGHMVKLEGIDIQIVGVVEDARSDNIHNHTLPYIFLPVEQVLTGWQVSQIEVRTNRNPETLANAVRSAVRRTNRTVPVGPIKTLADEVNGGLAREMLVGRLAGLFSILTLAIAAIGLYGIFAYETTLRRGEFAVRMALGAVKTHITWIVLRRALVILGVGSVAGIFLAIGVTREIQSLLFGTPSLDPWTYAVALTTLLSFATVAVILPARRAAALDPATILRNE